MSKEKQIDINIAVEEMASAVRERTVACNKCEYYKEGSCLKPIVLGCNDNEDILNLCDAIYEKGYRKASEVAGKIIKELEDFAEDNKKPMLIHGHSVWFINADDLTEFIAEIKEEYTEEGK